MAGVIFSHLTLECAIRSSLLVSVCILRHFCCGALFELGLLGVQHKLTYPLQADGKKLVVSAPACDNPSDVHLWGNEITVVGILCSQNFQVKLQ